MKVLLVWIRYVNEKIRFFWELIGGILVYKSAYGLLPMFVCVVTISCGNLGCVLLAFYQFGL